MVQKIDEMEMESKMEDIDFSDSYFVPTDEELEELDNELEEQVDDYDYSEERSIPMDPLSCLLREALPYKPLPQEEINALIRKGTKEAKEKVFNHNIRLALFVAKKYKDQGASYMDLFQVAAIGLMKAIEDYDPDKGYAFSTYATQWCAAYLRREIEGAKHTIRLPMYLVERIKAITIAEDQLQDAGMTPTPELIAAKTGLSASQVVKAINAAKRGAVLSLDAKTSDDTDNIAATVSDGINIEGDFIAAEQHDLLLETLHSFLKPKEAFVIIHQYGLEGKKMTFDQMAEHFECSKQRIGQISIKTHEKLRSPKGKKIMGQFL